MSRSGREGDGGGGVGATLCSAESSLTLIQCFLHLMALSPRALIISIIPSSLRQGSLQEEGVLLMLSSVRRTRHQYTGEKGPETLTHQIVFLIKNGLQFNPSSTFFSPSSSPHCATHTKSKKSKCLAFSDNILEFLFVRGSI